MVLGFANDNQPLFRDPSSGRSMRLIRAECSLLLLARLVAACGSIGKKSACDGLLYKEYGLDRKEYVPCAGEIIAAMDRLRPQLQAALEGDRSARTKARVTLSLVQLY